MNPIALRLHEMGLQLEGTGHDEIVMALGVAEREINRLDERKGKLESALHGIRNGAVGDSDPCCVDDALSYQEIEDIAAQAFRLEEFQGSRGEAANHANDLVDDVHAALNAAFAAALARIARLEADLDALKAPGPMAKRLAITSHRLPSGGGSIVIAFLTHSQAVDAHAWLASLPTENAG